MPAKINHYENFPVASVLCPPRLRPAIAAIYHFARTADDMADEGDASPMQRLQDLHEYHADLALCGAPSFKSRRWPGVFEALAKAIAQFKLPKPLLADLLSAFRQDTYKLRYASQTELLDYCRRSANPVGRLLLHLYDITDEAALTQSDCICTALQLINFWQDLSIDIPRGRIYLPVDSIAAHGVSELDLLALKPTPNAIKLIATNLDWAVLTMQKGQSLVKKVPGRAGWELRLVVQGGLRIAEKIRRLNHNTLQKRPKLNAWDWLVVVWRGLWMSSRRSD